jgi:alpha/beta hydrolase
MKPILCMAALCAAILVCADSPAQVPTTPEKAMRLWEGDAPFAKGKLPQDIPTLQAYFPANAKKPMPAILICPGGGYGGLAAGHEGEGYAQFFNQNGIAGFVLRYRLGSKGYRHPVMLTDVSRALRTIRANAGQWGINPDKIGVIGSSAGGHLAATLLTKFDNGNPKADNAIDRVSSRPDFGILCYPVISMKNGITHIGSRNNLIGKKPNPELIEELSAELHVRNNTPPCFIWHTAADRGVLPENSMRFAAALAKKNIPYDLHIYQKGGHGIGLRAKFPFTNAHPWSKDVVFWLKENKIID